MKIIQSLFRWSTLYIMIGLFIATFFWEENLQVSLNEHALLGCGILLFFGFVILRWIRSHEINFLAL